MDTLSYYQGIVERELANIALNAKPEKLYLPISYILNIGGKRIRPSICVSFCHFFSGNGLAAVPAALGIEVFHNFTLLHDDIMDNAAIRRNQPTVHEKWNSNTAILSGDAMMIVASKLMLDVPKHCFREVQQLYLDTALEVCEGQQYDMEFESSLDVSESDYLEMIRLKTAVLLAASMKIGALIGGASESDAEYAYQFGESLGLAFQLQDDYLDAFGDESLFGKSIGGDIVSNKKTFLLISCLNLCNSAQKTELLSWLEKKSFNNEEKIKAVKLFFSTHNIAELTKNRMGFYYQKALESLDKLSINEEFKVELKHFAEKLINRTR